MGAHTVTAPDGLALFARSHGERGGATPVVCIPGLTRNSRDFGPLAERLATDRLVVAVDLRGRGNSAWDPSARSYSLATYAEDVAVVVEEVVGAPVVVIGTSLGGLTAMWLASAHPGLVRGIVLNDIGPEIDPRGAARIASYAGKLPPVRTWDDAVAQTRLVSEQDLPGLDDEEWEQLARQRYRERPDGTVVVDHDPGITAGPGTTEDPWLVFSRLDRLPMAVLRGARSDVLAPATVAAMAESHPGLLVTEIPDRGHVPTLGEPLAQRAVDELLASVDAATPP